MLICHKLVIRRAVHLNFKRIIRQVPLPLHDVNFMSTTDRRNAARRANEAVASTLSPLAALLDKEQSAAHADDLLANILRDIADVILLVDAAGRIVYWNESAARLFGLAHHEGTPPRIVDLFPEALRNAENLHTRWQQLDRDERIENYETQLLTNAGECIDVIASQTIIRDARGQMIGYSAIIKDITTIKESERRIARRNAQLLALNTVAAAINELPGVAPLLERILDAVLRVTSLNAGSVHLLEDEDESLQLAAQRGLNERAHALIERFEMGEGIIGRAAVLCETLIVGDALNDARVSPRNLPEAEIGALVCVPLMARGGVVRGVLTLFHDSPRQFTEHEKGMLAIIGQQVGVALEHARLFEEVTTARREWEQTFDAMTDGVSIHAPSGRIRRANRALATLFGTTQTALIGVRCCELYHGSAKPRPDCTIMHTVTERKGQRVELHDRLHGRVLRVTTDPVINSQGRVGGVVCTTRDVTEEKLIERRLIQQERISAIGELAAGIAHEVGTPLNIISANAEYLLRGVSDERQFKAELQAIREQAGNITTLIRQLLDFARVPSPTFAPVNINILIEKTLGLLAHGLNHAGIECELNCAPYIPTVDGDAAQLQQVLFNIITNARQAMEAAQDSQATHTSARNRTSGTLRITTDSQLMPTEIFNRPHVVITIGDTGRGIPKDALPHVFEPFFTANKEGGTGLGLAISQRIIQKHLGLLTIESSSPRGTLACIRLPLAQS